MLEVGGHTASWKRVGARPRSRLVIDARGTSVIMARPADHREQRFGSPGNIHLFALVRCGTPNGPLDLVTPIADVPLIKWFFGGEPNVSESALLDNAVTPASARRLMSSKRARAHFATGCLLMVGSPAVAAGVPELPGSWIGVPYGIGCLLFVNGGVNILRARRRKRRHEAADQPDAPGP